MVKANFRGMAYLILFIIGLITSTGCYALPFSITPTAGTSLPTQVISGQTVTALYTVTNNTGSVRSGNYVKYLPPNVTQVTTDSQYSDLCGSTFTLNPSGTAGSSCTLELSISGSVNPNEPNPHDHLFVCFPGGITCAGTPNPLNVSTFTPSTSNRAYVSNYSSNSVSFCSISASTGKLSLCQDSGGGPFTTPIGVELNSDSTRFYVTNFNNSAGTSISFCSINATTGTFSDCADVDGDGSAVFSGPADIRFDHSFTQVYVSNLANSTVSLCSVNSGTGEFSGCATTGSSFTNPAGISLNSAGTRVYIANNQAATTVSMCSRNLTTGILSGCVNADGDGTAVFAGPSSAIFNAAETRVYITNNNGGVGTTVTLCAVNLITGKFSNCQDSGAGAIFSSPTFTELNANNTRIYISNQSGTSVTLCSINPTTGLLSGCGNADGDGTAVFSGPAHIIFD